MKKLTKEWLDKFNYPSMYDEVCIETEDNRLLRFHIPKDPCPIKCFGFNLGCPGCDDREEYEREIQESLDYFNKLNERKELYEEIKILVKEYDEINEELPDYMKTDLRRIL